MNTTYIDTTYSVGGGGLEGGSEGPAQGEQSHMIHVCVCVCVFALVDCFGNFTRKMHSVSDIGGVRR